MYDLLTGNGEQQKHKYLYWEYNGKQAVRFGKWKAIRTDSKVPDSHIELYDLLVDIAETNDIAENHPEVIAQMIEIMNQNHTPCPEPWQEKWNLVDAIQN